MRFFILIPSAFVFQTFDFSFFPDLIDIVKETDGHEGEEGEDPKLFISDKTKRGPLFENWLEDYWNEV